jgi:glyceraldehyde-3-phosphate dehydrogenase (NADP+)
MSASDAAYVRKDADLTKAGGMLAKAAFWNSGQSRNAIKRIYVDREVMDRFQEEFVREVGMFL